MQEKVYRTELSPVHFLARSASVFADKVALVHGDRQYSYREFAQRVNRLASGLRLAGLHKHERVAFLCPNTPALLEARISQLQAFLPSEWRDGRLSFLNSFLEQLEKAQLEQAVQVGMD